jgi:hypothetical protein
LRQSQREGPSRSLTVPTIAGFIGQVDNHQDFIRETL